MVADSLGFARPAVDLTLGPGARLLGSPRTRLVELLVDRTPHRNLFTWLVDAAAEAATG